jgi:undecaprenyl-diphosphatase
MTVDLPGWRRIVAHRRALVGFGAALLLVSGFLELSEDVARSVAEEPALARADRAVLLAFASVRRPWLTTVALDLTALGSPIVLTMFAILLAWALGRFGFRRSAVVLVVAAASSGAWTVLLKRFFERPRPDVVPRLVEVTGLSYPSGHSLGGAAVYATATLLLAARARSRGERGAIVLLGIALVLAIGVSRVYLGVHYPSDVLAGLAFGTAWALLLLGISASLPPAAAVAESAKRK